MKLAQIAQLALMVLEFAQKLEELLDPEEKSKIEDVILASLREIAKKIAQEG